MNASALVSIIICAYNAKDFIGETLQSVLAQTYPNIEIIVVDDGSTDETAATVHAYGSRIHYIFQKNQGLSVARNTGLGICRGEFIIFFDADDLLPADRIAFQVDYMKRYPGLGLSFVDYRNFDGGGPSQETHFQSCPRLQQAFRGRGEIILENACEDLLHENFGISGTMMIRRAILSRVPRFNPELRGAEDLNFYYQLARYTHVGLINVVGMFRRLHASNLSGHRETMLPAIVRNYTELFRTEEKPSARRLLQKKMSQAWMAFARYEANQSHLLRSMVYEGWALLADPMPLTLFKSARNICRAISIAVGLHRPTDK